MRGLLVLAAIGGVAHADEALEPGTTDAKDPTENRINMRVGGASTDSTSRPVICLDVRVFYKLDIEACGSGQGVIHDEPGTEMVHFRATWSVIDRLTRKGRGKVRAGVGFAELQVGLDRPGFDFGDPDAPDFASVAGPEAAVQAQWLVPIAKGVEAVASATAGVALFSAADKLVVPKDNVQPFVSFEIGIGW
jgi:hypothetical protein